MTNRHLNISLLILLTMFISACTSPNLTQPQVTPSPSQTGEGMGPITIPDDASLQVIEVVDVEQQFIAAYRAEELAEMSNDSVNVANIKVKFEGWSPDGKYMLLRVKTGEVLEGKLPIMADYEGKAGIGLANLWLADKNGNILSQLAEAVSWVAWSPDSTKIAYVKNTLIDNIIFGELWLIDADGNNLQKLTTRVRDISWLDENIIIFVEETTEQLHLFDLADGLVKPFEIKESPSPNPQAVIYQLSPAKKKIAFYARGGKTLTIANIKNHVAQTNFNIEIPDLPQMGWSPDGKLLALTPQCSGNQLGYEPMCHQIQIVHMDGKVVMVIDDYNSDSHIGWAPNNQAIFFLQAGHLYLANIEENEVEILYTFNKRGIGNATGPYLSSQTSQIGFNRDAISGATLLKLNKN